MRATTVEALWAGTPNRTAIRLVGTEQTGIKHVFEAVLAAWADADPAGIGLAGGFSTGKSHILGYPAEVARQHGSVVSRAVVSKETPLSQSCSTRWS